MSPNLAPPPCRAGSALPQRWLALPPGSCLNSDVHSSVVSAGPVFFLSQKPFDCLRLARCPGEKKISHCSKVPCVFVRVCVCLCVFVCVFASPAHILVHCLKHARTHTLAHTHARTRTHPRTHTHTRTHTDKDTDRHTHS